MMLASDVLEIVKKYHLGPQALAALWPSLNGQVFFFDDGSWLWYLQGKWIMCRRKRLTKKIIESRRAIARVGDVYLSGDGTVFAEIFMTKIELDDEEQELYRIMFEAIGEKDIETVRRMAHRIKLDRKTRAEVEYRARKGILT